MRCSTRWNAAGSCVGIPTSAGGGLRIARLRPLREPELERSRVGLASEAHSYEPGILGGAAPGGMSNDRLEAVLGVGDGVWEVARSAIDEWAPFDLGWTEIATGDRSPYPGQDVIVQARILGLRFAVASRVIEVHDRAGDHTDTHGFTYGTLHSHVVRGEELFEVWHDRATGEVGYRIHAMAAPGNWYARLGRPVVDHYRGRFRRDSGAAMARAVRASL